MSDPNIQQFFPFVPAFMTWEEWTGNFIMWYGQNAIPLEKEENWKEAANHLNSLPTFSAYPLPDPNTYANWREWAKGVTEIINGPSH